MGRFAKVGIVVTGYVAAFIAAGVTAWLYDVWAKAQPYDTSGGMYAAGQAMTAFGVFLVVALVPTILALWFLRGNGRFWNAVSIGSLGFAAVGLLAVLVTLTINTGRVPVWSMLLSLIGLAQLLGVPLWFVAFALFALLAPTPKSRRTLIFAVAIEFVIGVCAFIHWFAPALRI